MNLVNKYKNAFANESFVTDDYGNEFVIYHDFTTSVFNALWENFKRSKHSLVSSEILSPLKERLKGMDLNEVMFGKEYAGMMNRLRAINTRLFPEKMAAHKQRAERLLEAEPIVCVRKISIERFLAYITAKQYPHASMSRQEYEAIVGIPKKKAITIKSKKRI